MFCYVVPVGGRYSVCDNGHTNTKRPRVLGKEYRGWGRRRMGGLASVTQSATEHGTPVARVERLTGAIIWVASLAR